MFIQNIFKMWFFGKLLNNSISICIIYHLRFDSCRTMQFLNLSNFLLVLMNVYLPIFVGTTNSINIQISTYKYGVNFTWTDGISTKMRATKLKKLDFVRGM